MFLLEIRTWNHFGIFHEVSLTKKKKGDFFLF